MTAQGPYNSPNGVREVYLYNFRVAPAVDLTATFTSTITGETYQVNETNIFGFRSVFVPEYFDEIQVSDGVTTSAVHTLNSEFRTTMVFYDTEEIPTFMFWEVEGSPMSGVLYLNKYAPETALKVTEDGGTHEFIIPYGEMFFLPNPIELAIPDGSTLDEWSWPGSPWRPVLSGTSFVQVFKPPYDDPDDLIYSNNRARRSKDLHVIRLLDNFGSLGYSTRTINLTLRIPVWKWLYYKDAFVY